MGLFDRVVKAIRPVYDGNASFASYGVPPESNTLEDLKKYNNTVYTCVRAISQEIGNLDIKLYRNDKEIQKHWLLDLINNPNPTMRLTTYGLLEYTQTFIELADECFWYLARGSNTGDPKLVFLLRPDKMTVVPDSSGGIAGYVLKKEDGTKTAFELNEIIHFKNPNPTNFYRGYGTTRASRDFIQTDEYASKWVRNSFFNGARPSALVSFKGNVSTEEFEKVKKEWKKQYGGVDNASKTAFVKGADLDYQELSLGLDKVAIRDIKQMTRDDVMFMFRVSKPMLGILEDVNMASAKTANYAFMARVIKPKMQMIVDTLEQFVRDEGITIKFTSPVEVDKIEQADYFAKMLNVGLTTNEIRAEIGKDPIENGDMLYQPMNLIPVGAPIKQNPNSVKTTTRRIVKEAVEVKSQTSDKPSPDNTKLIHWKTMIGIRNAWLKRYQHSMGSILKAEKKSVLASLATKKKDINGVTPDPKKMAEQWLLTMTPIALGLYTDEAQYASDIVGTGVNIGATAEQTITERLSKVFSEFDTRRISALSDSLAEGYMNNETLTQLSDRVSEVYSNYEGYQSERLARTETKKLANDGAYEAYNQSQVVTGKQWFTNPDGCGFCQEMNGKVVDLQNNFLELGQTLGFTDGDGNTQTMGISFDSIDTPDLHPNCECILLPYSEEFDTTGSFGTPDAGA